jgi:sulfide:quinone oxidoreductase
MAVRDAPEGPVSAPAGFTSIRGAAWAGVAAAASTATAAKVDLSMARICRARRHSYRPCHIYDARRCSVRRVKQHVLILGAGFGGLELATRLSETLHDAVRVTLLDRNDAFIFGYSKLEVMLGRQSPEEIRLPYAAFVKDGVEFRQETVVAIDPAARHVTTDANTYEADYLVIAMGADYDMAATPGLEQGGFEFYTVPGAARLRDKLADFDGGKVIVSVLGQPFKCPPAPFEGAFLLHELFTQKGIRDDVELMSAFPMQRPVPVTGEVSQMFRDALASRGIEERSQTLVTSLDPATGTAHLKDGGTLPYDLFIGIPVHRAPDPLTASGLAVDGWVPVDQANLRTQFPHVYAIGDVCTGPRTVPKAGIFAESAALVVAGDIAASIAGGEEPDPYGGSGICYAEFGDGLVSKVEVNFLSGPAAVARRNEPSRAYAADKVEFGRARRARWFGIG